MLRFTHIEALGCRAAAFSARKDGDCSWSSDENAANREALLITYDAEGNVWSPTQVHGTTVLPVLKEEAPPDTKQPEEGDAVITQIAGLPIGITAADCVPVFLFDPVRKAGGVVHAGRAGTASGVCKEAVHAMERTYGCNTRDIVATIGPSAGPCCYEVDSQIAGTFRALGYPVRKRHLDLWNANAMQLKSAGLRRKNIEVTGFCTICDGGFYSYRRGDKTERNLAFMIL